MLFRSRFKGFSTGRAGTAMNQIDMRGRCAVVTGAASGIGAQICLRFAESGARVAVWDIDGDAASGVASSLSPVASGDHVGVQVDVANETSVESAMQRTLATLGRLDVMVCSAGITGPNKVTWEYHPDEWRKVIDVNLNGVYL